MTTQQVVETGRDGRTMGPLLPVPNVSCSPADDAICKVIGWGHRVPPACLPIEQVLGEYSLSFLRRYIALFVSARARDSF